MATLNTVPSFTDNVAVIAAQTLARGSTARGTLDLRSLWRAYLFLRIGRGGTTVLSAGIDILIRRLNNNDGDQGQHPAGQPALRSSTAVAASTTVAVDSAAGQAALNVALITGFAAGDIVCLWDSGNTTFARLEFQRVSKTATGVLTLDRPLHFAHTAAQADTVRNASDTFAPIELPGGALWEVIFDYGSQSTGDTAVVQAIAQTHDKNIFQNT